MFTGLIREVGRVAGVTAGSDGRSARDRRAADLGRRGVGDSVAINGVCLTVVAVDGGRLAFDAVPETLARSSLGRLAAGSPVNLEPALRAGDALGGHYVQGHVDGVGTVRSGRAAKATGGASGSTRRPTCSATSSRRARSRSRGPV